MYQVYYDTNHKNAVEQLDQMSVDDYIDACFTHAQANYCDRTGLGTVVQIEVITSLRKSYLALSICGS